LDSEKWSQEFAFINSEYLDALAKGFKKVIKGKASIEDIRDSIRLELYEICPEDFLMGTSYASVEDLAFKILSSDQVISELQLACSECDYAEVEVDGNLGYILHGQSHGTPTSTLKWIAGLKEKSTKKKCSNCLGKMVEQQYYTTVPKLIVFEYLDMDIKTSHCIKFKDKTVLNLRCIVYHGDNHFTCRIISPDGYIWFHDGISTGNACEDDGYLQTISDKELRTCQEKKLVLAVYA
jgi:hypothetical protein